MILNKYFMTLTFHKVV